jgi:hypothetical protein
MPNDREPGSVASAIAGASAVVNAVSAYVEKAGVTYTAVHVDGVYRTRFSGHKIAVKRRPS